MDNQKLSANTLFMYRINFLMDIECYNKFLFCYVCRFLFCPESLLSPADIRIHKREHAWNSAICRSRPGTHCSYNYTVLNATTNIVATLE